MPDCTFSRNMDYSIWNTLLTLTLACLAVILTPGVFSWQQEWHPNYVSMQPGQTRCVVVDLVVVVLAAK